MAVTTDDDDEAEVDVDIQFAHGQADRKAAGCRMARIAWGSTPLRPPAASAGAVWRWCALSCAGPDFPNPPWSRITNLGAGASFEQLPKSKDTRAALE